MTKYSLGFNQCKNYQDFVDYGIVVEKGKEKKSIVWDWIVPVGVCAIMALTLVNAYLADGIFIK